jgi:hypothetical protein
MQQVVTPQWKSKRVFIPSQSVTGKDISGKTNVTELVGTGLGYIWMDGDGYVDKTPRATITHIASGLRFPIFFFSVEDVKKVIEGMSSMFDWTQPEEELMKNAALLESSVSDVICILGVEWEEKAERVGERKARRKKKIRQSWNEDRF